MLHEMSDVVIRRRAHVRSDNRLKQSSSVPVPATPTSPGAQCVSPSQNNIFRITRACAQIATEVSARKHAKRRKCASSFTPSLEAIAHAERLRLTTAQMKVVRSAIGPRAMSAAGTRGGVCSSHSSRRARSFAMRGYPVGLMVVVGRVIRGCPHGWPQIPLKPPPNRKTTRS